MSAAWFHPDLNEPCCPDVSKRVCFGCRRHVRTRLSILAHNLAVAGGLCRAFSLGAYKVVIYDRFGTDEWEPGCRLVRS